MSMIVFVQHTNEKMIGLKSTTFRDTFVVSGYWCMCCVFGGMSKIVAHADHHFARVLRVPHLQVDTVFSDGENVNIWARSTNINGSKNPVETGQTEVGCVDKNKKKNSATGDENVSCSNGD